MGIGIEDDIMGCQRLVRVRVLTKAAWVSLWLLGIISVHDALCSVFALANRLQTLLSVLYLSVTHTLGLSVCKFH